MFEYFVAVILGLCAGFLFNRLAAVQIKKRTKSGEKPKDISKLPVVILWMLISAALFAAIVWREDKWLTRIELFIYTSVLLNIACVDFKIRKIPNELLLVLLVAKTVFLSLALIDGEPFKVVMLPSLLGLVVGFVLFFLPALLRVSIGAGDLKFSAVIGFCLGYRLFLQAMILMAVFVLIYLVYLLVTKKGNLKTVTAMGPYLAIGSVLTMLFPYTAFMAG